MPAEAGVTRLEITGRQPYASGQSFGTVGPYERLTGRAVFEVDPRSEANSRVVDLALAPRTTRATVEFSADFEILRPADMARGNGVLLYDVNNRGGMTAPGMFNTGGDDYLMRMGYTLVASGWIAELLPTAGKLILQAPVALHGGKPIRGLVRAEMAPDAPADRLSISHWAGHGSYPPTSSGLERATLTVRLREKDPRVRIRRSRWRLESRSFEAGGRRSALPLVELVLEGGFHAGHLYELVYEAEGSIVQGLGLAGIRDLVSYLRHGRGAGHPLLASGNRTAIQATIGFGTSQSGRCLRQFLYDGFNADEQGRRVFDGIWPHVAGAGRGSFNHRFASPTRHAGQHDNHSSPVDLFPFTYGEERDPYSGRRDGLLRSAAAKGVTPYIIHTQTSAEYWTRGGSLVHTDPTGTLDALIPPEVRIYAFGGAQHGPGTGLPGAASAGQQPGNPTDYRPLMRALLRSLERWIRLGEAPPPSRYPRLVDGTLAEMKPESSRWRLLPGVRYPTVIHRPEAFDFGPDWDSLRRMDRLPPRSRGVYGALVPVVGPDNNERGMLQVPTVAVPIGTYTGWNLRSPHIGAETELLSLAGSFIPFARDHRQRVEKDDPRPSLAELYLGRADYLRRIEAEVISLRAQGYLLDEDRPRVLDLATRLAAATWP